MNPVFLHLAGRHLGQAKVAEEGKKVQAETDRMACDPARAALALCDNLVFLEELGGRLPERLF